MSQLIIKDEKSYEVEIAYWKEKLQGVIPVTLPNDFSKTAFITNETSSIDFAISEELTGQLQVLSSNTDTNIFDVFLAVFEVLLFRYSNQEDICLGCIPASNSIQASLGKNAFPENLIAIRNNLNGEDIFGDLLKRVKNSITESFNHQIVPFEKISIDFSGESKTLNSICNVLFVYGNVFDRKRFDTIIAQSDITLNIVPTAAAFSAIIIYNKNLFKTETIERLGGHYLKLLQDIIKNSNTKIGALKLLSNDEEFNLLVKFNHTLSEYPAEKTLVDIFEEQVARTPDAIALRQHDRTMTYLELNQKANRLAHFLIDAGTKPADNIGIIATRSFEMIIGMFGILKSGGAYVPIDPEYPIGRQEYILDNSATAKVIADNDYPLKSLVPAADFIKINELDLGNVSVENPGVKIDSKQLAYTIYTSGSTGRPKGVMIEHHSAVNLCHWVNKEYQIGSNDRLLFITSMCFDLSVYDIFGILATGGSIIIVEQHELMDIPRLKEMMLNDKVTFWDSVPTTMDYLIRELESRDQDFVQETLKIVFLSGDWIPVNLPDRIRKYFPNAQVISLGGATEGTIWSNYFPIKEVDKSWTSIPYGRPLANNFFYILNEQMQPQPIGVPGELYIGGVGVARGYANDAEKTNYSFVRDTFSDHAGGRMYRTGDLGRMLPDYTMEFIGRKDDQVKIRGFRIELGEIESVLRQCNLVEQAVVLAKADQDKKRRLVAYVVGNENYHRDAVIDFLKEKLPEYMIPTLWMELDALPLTSNNKIDKKALPDFDAGEQIKETYVAPRTGTEKAVADIWQSVLKLNRVGIEDNFFDIGGHSLIAVQIMTRIEKKLGKKIPIAKLFQYPTVSLLSGFITKEDKENIKWKSIVPIKKSGSKTPFYIVHGAGLNVLTFNDLAARVSPDQPVFGLQGFGLDGEDIAIESISDIAKKYFEELIKHNPDGPFALGGYSIGGFIALEIARQLEQSGREVKLLAIFDTDADNCREMEPWYVITPKVIKRYLPKFMGGKKSLLEQIIYVFRERKLKVNKKLGFHGQGETDAYYTLLDKLTKKYFDALHHHRIEPVNFDIHLFKADFNDHYNNDDIYLGWPKYTIKEVKRYQVPGNHLTMMVPPNVKELGRVVQKVLDEVV